MRNEAALSILKGRMHEGRRHKAPRGDLWHHPPMGEVRGADGESQLAPDEQAQRVVRLMCEVGEQPGSRQGVLRSLVAHDRRLPLRPHRGATRGQLEGRRPHRRT